MGGYRARLYALPCLTGILLKTLPPVLRDVLQRSGPIQMALGLLDAADLPLSFALQWRAYLDQWASAPLCAER